MAQKETFTKDQDDAVKITERIIDLGIEKKMKAHAKTLKARADRLKAEANERENAGIRQQERRAERKAAREKRAKDQAKAKMRDEVRRLLIDKGAVMNPVASTELLDINGCYEKKQFLGSLGGQIQQLYYVVNAILKQFPEDSLRDYYDKLAEDPKQEALKNPRSPRELLLENHFLPWFITTIKELKCEHLQFLITPELEKVFGGWKLPRNGADGLDFTRINNEQYIQFRHAIVEERMFNPTYKSNKGHKAMDLILSALCMVICNRVPKGVVSFRTDSLAQKIKFVNPPRGVEAFRRTQVEKVPVSADCPTGEQETVIEPNTNERAIVRILVPKRTMTMSEIANENQQQKPEEEGQAEGVTPAKENEEEGKAQKSGEVPPTPEAAAEDSKLKEPGNDAGSQRAASRLSRVPSERIIEQDQEDRALAIASRINLAQPYMVLQMNQYAAR